MNEIRILNAPDVLHAACRVAYRHIRDKVQRGQAGVERLETDDPFRMPSFRIAPESSVTMTSFMTHQVRMYINDEIPGRPEVYSTPCTQSDFVMYPKNSRIDIHSENTVTTVTGHRKTVDGRYRAVMAMFTLNDEFSGGKFLWPDQKFSIKPHTNSLIMFPIAPGFDFGMDNIVGGQLVLIRRVYGILDSRDTGLYEPPTLNESCCE